MYDISMTTRERIPRDKPAGCGPHCRDVEMHRYQATTDRVTPTLELASHYFAVPLRVEPNHVKKV